MSYVVYIVEQAVPDSDDDAWQHIESVLARREGERALPANPVFLALIERLTARFPCICELPEEEEENGVWSDGPLRNNAAHSVTVLGMVSSRVDDALPFLVQTANALELVVFDEQEGKIHRPRTPSLTGTKVETTATTSFTFRVRITGVKEGYTKDHVAARLARLFKRPASDIRSRLDNDAMVVKREVDEDTASKYAAFLEQHGCVCVTEWDSLTRSLSIAPAETTEDMVTRFRRRAEDGDAESQFELGCHYAEASGFSTNDEQAMKWWDKAAQQGHAKAQYNLGCSYFNGTGVAPDHEQAVRWFRAAAEQNFPDAQEALARCYYNGEGVPQNFKLAYYWYRKMAEGGSASAQYKLTEMHYLKQIDPVDYTKAFEWCSKAAEQGHAQAQVMLGSMYDSGKGVKRDYKQAAIWYRKSADQGKASAQWNLAVMYDKGHGVPKDAAQYEFWMRKAAAQGDEDACRWLDRLNRSRNRKPFWKIW